MVHVVTVFPCAIFEFQFAYFLIVLKVVSYLKGSWTYGGDKIDIQFLGKNEINQDSYLASNEWEIVSAQGQRSQIKYELLSKEIPEM